MLSCLQQKQQISFINKYKEENYTIKEILNFSAEDEEAREALHYRAKELLKKGRISEAWKTLLIDKLNRT